MNRLALERHQVWVYLVAIALGLAVGAAQPAVAPVFEALLWPALMLLLYATFVQIALLHLREALVDRRFVAVTLLGNFVLIPLVVAMLVAWLPPDPALRLGVLLVLLMPCTDWFISFCQLGRGDTPRAIAVTPLNLVLQLLLLPFYMWLLADSEMIGSLGVSEVGPALVVVLLPLAAAMLSERWIEAKAWGGQARQALAWSAVPLLAVVVFLIAGAQVALVTDAAGTLPQVVPVFAAFLVIAALLARLLARLFHLPPAQGRTLAFSLGTRNSFVVLPFALALPQGWDIVAVVIVVQSLVELLGMALYLLWIPNRLFPDRP